MHYQDGKNLTKSQSAQNLKNGSDVFEHVLFTLLRVVFHNYRENCISFKVMPRRKYEIFKRFVREKSNNTGKVRENFLELINPF